MAQINIQGITYAEGNYDACAELLQFFCVNVLRRTPQRMT